MSGGILSYLGCKISLISKSEIRYEGTLYTIDSKEGTVALQRGLREILKKNIFENSKKKSVKKQNKNKNKTSAFDTIDSNSEDDGNGGEENGKEGGTIGRGV